MTEFSQVSGALRCVDAAVVGAEKLSPESDPLLDLVNALTGVYLEQLTEDADCLDFPLSLSLILSGLCNTREQSSLELFEVRREVGFNLQLCLLFHPFLVLLSAFVHGLVVFHQVLHLHLERQLIHHSFRFVHLLLLLHLFDDFSAYEVL